MRRHSGHVTRGVIAAVLAMAAFSSSSQAAVYKWVDERGVTHYSEKPPQGRKPAEIPIRAQPAPAGGEDSQRRAKTWQEQEAEFQQRRIEREERRINGQALERATGDRTRNCLAARHDLEILDKQRPVYRVDQRGERVYIGDKERAQFREKLRRIVERDCEK